MSRFLMTQDQEPEPENGGGGESEKPAEEPQPERTYAGGKYKSVEDLEKGYGEESKVAGRARRAFAALQEAGYGVDEAGNIYALNPQQFQQEPDSQAEAQAEPEFEDTDSKLDKLMKEVTTLRQQVGDLSAVADNTSLSAAQSEKQALLSKLPENLREQGSRAFDEAVRGLPPAQRNPRVLALTRHAVMGSLVDEHGAWGPPAEPKPSEASGDLLEQTGGADRPGPERRGPGRPPGSATEREVAEHMIATGNLKDKDGNPMTVDAYISGIRDTQKKQREQAGEQ